MRSQMYRYLLRIDRSLCARPLWPVGMSSTMTKTLKSPKRACRTLFEWHLNYPAQVASTPMAEHILGGRISQAALTDGAMKPGASISIRNTSVLLHLVSNAQSQPCARLCEIIQTCW